MSNKMTRPEASKSNRINLHRWSPQKKLSLR